MHVRRRIHACEEEDTCNGKGALARHSGDSDTHACWRKEQRGSGVHCVQLVTTVWPRNEVTLSPCACTDCWGCVLQHGVKTVRPLGGAAFFPCYSINAARNLLATAVRHTVTRCGG